MNLFNSNKPSRDHEALLDQVLLKIPRTSTPITWADIVEGIMITGSTGSGKSSGPGKTLALAMLRSGFGGCVLCAKASERKQWEDYAKVARRQNDVVIFNKNSPFQFNFLEYELKRSGDGAGDIFNANNALMNINQLARQYQSGDSSNSEERFWDTTLRYLISMSILTLILANEEVSVFNMRKLVSGSFTKENVGEYTDLIRRINNQELDMESRQQAIKEFDELRESNYFVHVLFKIQSADYKNEEDLEDLDKVEDYWLVEFAQLAERSRSIIVASFTGIIAPFMNRGILKSKFAKGLSAELLPENIINDQKIIIVDFSTKEFGLSGIFASIIYKSVFMAAMERRNVQEEILPKPVFLWIDEAQNFINAQVDSLFQATARSSWVSTVMITQNLNGLYPLMGNIQPQAKAKSLLGNLNLKFFANNADYETNFWASQMIGKHMTNLDTLSISKNMDLSKSKKQSLEQRIQPECFMGFKTGRKRNRYKVEALVFKAGKIFGKDNANFVIAEFDQRNS